MRLAVDEEAKREVVGSLGVEHVRLALRRFGLADIGERERVARIGAGEHAEREPREVLLEPVDARSPHGVHRVRHAGRRARPGCAPGRNSGGCGRGGILQQLVAVEPGRRRAALLRRNFVLAQILVGQLYKDLELDRHQIVAAHLARASGCRKRLDRRQLAFTAERLTRGREHAGRVFLRRRGGLRGHRPSWSNDPGREKSHGGTLCENAHV
jgi:hypothetical protein